MPVCSRTQVWSFWTCCRITPSMIGLLMDGASFSVPVLLRLVVDKEASVRSNVLDVIIRLAKDAAGAPALVAGGAIKLLVENLDQASTDAEQAGAKVQEKLRGIDAALTQRQNEHASLQRAVEADGKRQRDAIKQLEGSCASLQSEAAAAKTSLGRQADKLKGLEGDLMGFKRESSEASAQQRSLKASIKEVTDGLSAHKKEVRRTNDQNDMRYEAYDEACAAFAEALKMANPVAAALSSAAAAL